MEEAAVKVAVRVRPLTAKERLENCMECINIVSSSDLVIGKNSFTFDHVFTPEIKQEECFKMVEPLIKKFIQGYNATVLAYGQTGSGKTFTMGTGLETSPMADDAGIVQRAIEYIINSLSKLSHKADCQLSCIFLELYNEELIDLLNPKSRKGLSIREDANGYIYWSGVTEQAVSSVEDLFKVLHLGTLCRSTGSTDMNLTSSRSHAIFSLSLKQKIQESEINGGEIKNLFSKLHFIDLAGSERMKKTNATGDRAKESISINSGLLAMGKVIHALNNSSNHIPYRDSKLTRLLQDSLGGNSETLMIACVSPSDSNFGETLNTLGYAARARNIRNKVILNQNYQEMELHSLRAEISRLKIELMSKRTGLDISSDLKIKKQNDTLKSECQKLEAEVFQLQVRLNESKKEIVSLKAERDSLLFSRDENQNISGDNINPMILNYIQTISDLQSKRDERTKSVESFHTPFASYGNLSQTAKIDETIEKARLQIRKEMNVLRMKSEPNLSKKTFKDDDPSEDDASTFPSGAEDICSEIDTENAAELEINLEKIQNDITIKEELVENLEKVQAEYDFMKLKYEEKLKLMADNIVSIQKERDDALKKSDGGSESEKSLKSRYEAKIRKLTNEMNDAQKKFEDSQKEIQRKVSTNENLLQNMKFNVDVLKKEKQKILRVMKEKENIFKENQENTQKQLSDLKRKNIRVTSVLKNLEKNYQIQKSMLKKRTEEHVKTQSKLRSVMTLLKKTRPMSSPIFKLKSNSRPHSAEAFKHMNGTSSPLMSKSGSKRSFFKPPSIFEVNQRDEERVKMQTSFKKNLLYHEINNYVLKRQYMKISEELLKKRRELSEEREELVKNTTNDVDKEEIMSRIEIIDAEIEYLTAKLRSIQLTSSQTDGEESNPISPIALNLESPDINSNLENAIDLIRSLDTSELRQMSEMLVEDIIQLEINKLS